MLHGFFSTAFEKCRKMRYMGFICIVLVIVLLAVYIQVGNHQFLNFDDTAYVTKNPHVASGITGKNIIWAFTSVDANNWHPITWLSHMADAQFFGMSPRGHHLTNVVIHAVSSVLLLLLLFRLTGAIWQSSFVAFMFALHPLHVESVAWVAERKDVLSALFWFLTLIVYVEFTAKRKSTQYIFSLICFVLGLMSKPMLVTLPVVMLLIDFWPLNRFRDGEQELGLRHLLSRVVTLTKEKIPFFACSLLSVAVTIYAQHQGGAMAGLNDISFPLRIENALIAYVKYIGKTLWPHELAVYYPFPLSIPLWQVLSSLLVLLLFSAAAIRVRGQHRYVTVGWFWFLVTLVPVIGIIQVGNQSMADRYSYISVIGLFIIAAWGVPDLTKGLQHRQCLLALLASAVIVASTALTWQQLGYWQDNISLYRRTLQVTTGNYLIHNNLGLALAGKGDLDAAIQEYQEAIRINPFEEKVHNNLGIAHASKGHLDAAIQEYQEALRINPIDTDVLNNLGVALDEKRDMDAAIQAFQKAIRIDPDYSAAHYNLGFDFAIKGDLDAAIHEYREVLRITPNDTDAYNNLVSVLAQKKMQDKDWK